MTLRKLIQETIHDYFNVKKPLKENVNNIDKLLDKINKSGLQSLSHDENEYLNQYKNNNIDSNLEKWLFTDDENTFNDEGEKLLYDEFEEDEYIFYNIDKLKRVISKHLNKKPFTNNADWSGAYVWNVNSNDNNIGTFLYLGDDSLELIKRTLNGDSYNDEIITTINNSKDLYKLFTTLKKK